MTYQPYVHLYSGATCEDVYAEQDDRNYDVTLELLATPQCSLVSSEYSEVLVETMAREMWDEISEFYQMDRDDNPEAPDIKFEDLIVVTSTKVVEYPEDYTGERSLKEITVIEYASNLQPEALIQIVVQTRRLSRPNNLTQTDTDRVTDFDTAPGVIGNQSGVTE